ncbi:MAG: zinc-ribbon domain-containing protein [Clostridia bacterium]|nr:zinc-ribbon domain-containing protein [Clostridia bacterium]
MPLTKGNTCPHCGGALKDDWKFCLSCGSKL